MQPFHLITDCAWDHNTFVLRGLDGKNVIDGWNRSDDREHKSKPIHFHTKITQSPQSVSWGRRTGEDTFPMSVAVMAGTIDAAWYFRSMWWWWCSTYDGCSYFVIIILFFYTYNANEWWQHTHTHTATYMQMDWWTMAPASVFSCPSVRCADCVYRLSGEAPRGLSVRFVLQFDSRFTHILVAALKERERERPGEKVYYSWPMRGRSTIG